MKMLKERMLGAIEARARRRAGALSRELAGAESAEKEAIRAGLEFERWLADSCRSVRELR